MVTDAASVVQPAPSQFQSEEAARAYGESYAGWGPYARYYRSRMYLVWQFLQSVPCGDLLDVGCGPGMMVHDIVVRRPGDFRIAAIDASAAMVAACQERIGDAANVRPLVARAEAMPYEDESFDVVLAMGVLEYTDSRSVLAEIGRVSRPGALVLVTMLNPLSPYRFVEWHILLPVARLVGRMQGLFGVPADQRHGRTPIETQAYRQGQLVEMVTAAGMRPFDVAYYDVTPLVPPIDRYLRRWARGWQARPHRTISRGWLKWLGTAYLVAAQRDHPVTQHGD
jgi:ubiquinone/menaquinone biosynthesis C-methylase UbiE